MTKEKQSGYRFFVYVVGVTAALAGLLFGLDVGVISGALPLVKKTFTLSTIQEELVVSSVLVGAVLGTLISGVVSRHYGRRFSILLSAVIFCIGSVLSAVSVDVTMLILVRVFLGLALGIASFTAPLYLSEVSPKQIRGGLIALYQLMITIGILLAYISDSLFMYIESWRWMLGVIFFPSFFMFIAVLLLPKSPRWLMLRGNEQAAISVLGRVRYQHEVEPEAREIKESLRDHGSIKKVLKNPLFMKVLMLGVVFQAIQQFSGMNTIMYYAPEIFKLAGFTDPVQQMWATVIVGLVNVLTTFIAIAFVDRVGRRPILLFGLSITTLSMLILGLLFHMGLEANALGPWAKYVASIVVLCFIFGFAVSLGPVIWILCSEIFPLQGRDFGVTCSTASNWVCNAIVGFTFLSMLNGLGVANTFWVYAGLGLISLLVIIRFAPETKGVSLEQIEDNLFAGKPMRQIGRWVVD